MSSKEQQSEDKADLTLTTVIPDTRETQLSKIESHSSSPPESKDNIESSNIINIETDNNSIESPNIKLTDSKLRLELTSILPSKLTDLSYFWWFCFILSLCGYGTLIYIINRAFIDSTQLHFAYGVGYPLFVVTLCTTGLCIKHFVKWHSGVISKNSDLWNWSSYLVGSLESWSLLSLSLLLTLKFVRGHVTRESKRKHSIVITYGLYGNSGMFLILFTLHMWIIKEQIPALLEKNVLLLGRQRSYSVFDEMTKKPIVTGLKHWFKMIITTLIPYELFTNTDVRLLGTESNNNSNNNLEETFISEGNEVIQQISSQYSNLSDDEILSNPSVLTDREISTGWIILTWQLFVIQGYVISSELIGFDEIGFTRNSRTWMFILTLVIHALVMVVATRLCIFYRRKFKKYTYNAGFEVFVPLFMAFFCVLYKVFWIVTGVVYITGPNYVKSETYNKYQREKLFWPVLLINTLVEIVTIYNIFDLTFLRPMPKNISELNLRQHNSLLHVYHAMLAYGTSTIFISTLVIVLNENLYYQFLISFEYCTFGNLYNNKADKIIATSAEEVSGVLSYYIIGLVLIVTLGRSNRISFLWRAVADIGDKLKEQKRHYKKSVKSVVGNELYNSQFIDNHCLDIQATHDETNKNNSNHITGNTKDINKIKGRHRTLSTVSSTILRKRKARSLTGLWQVMVLTAICLSLLFGTRIITTINWLEITAFILCGILAIVFTFISVKLFRNVWFRHINECNNKSKDKRKYSVRLSRSQYLFIIACVLTSIYHIILALYQVSGEEGVLYKVIHFWFSVCAIAEAVIGVNHYYKCKKWEIAVLVILNIIFFIYVIAADLEEQLLISSNSSNSPFNNFTINENTNNERRRNLLNNLLNPFYNILSENASTGEPSEEEENTPKWQLVSSALFFANGEVFWGMMEAAQHAMTHGEHAHIHHD